MKKVDESILVIKDKVCKYPRSYYQFRALRACWMKSSSPMKDAMIEMLTLSMKEVVEVYNMEQDALKELNEWKDVG